MKKELPKDPDLLGATKALERSAASALRLARKTHTPCIVFKDGQIVDAAQSINKTLELKKQRATG